MKKKLNVYWMNSNRIFEDGKIYSEHELIEVENNGGTASVMVLSDQEAKAYISEEYGFEYNSIKIEGTCWYEATDFNYFKFSVKGWTYIVENLEVLTLSN